MLTLSLFNLIILSFAFSLIVKIIDIAAGYSKSLKKIKDYRNKINEDESYMDLTIDETKKMLLKQSIKFIFIIISIRIIRKIYSEVSYYSIPWFIYFILFVLLFGMILNRIRIEDVK